MIYLITGVPGSGKTLYAVSTLIKKLAAEKVTDRYGTQIERRVCVDGIKDLAIPHELMAPTVEDEKGGFTCEGDGVLNWFKWCKPGDVIVIDEVQRVWRPRGMGTKPPEMIKHLETHRHLGIDFVIITQNPMIIDQNARRLVGRHQHVRRIFGMARALIYDWDGCSADVHRTSGATTSMWNYPKSAYKLYTSSELHTKQRQKIPPWLIIPALGLVGACFAVPAAFGTMSKTIGGKGLTAPVAAASAPAPVPSRPIAATAALPPASAPVLAASGASPEAKPPQLAGCFADTARCGCVDTTGKPFKLEESACREHIAGFSKPGSKIVVPDTAEVAPVVSRPDDNEVLAYIARHRHAF